MKNNIIASSSSGNAILLENGILLDCGVSYNKIKTYLKDIKAIFISHLWLHLDHCKDSTIKKIAFEYPNIKFITNQVNTKHLVDLGVNKKNIFGLKLDTWYNIGICKIRLEYLIHDKPNCTLKINQNGYKLIYIVDTGSIDHIKAKNYNYAFIEANYETDEELDKKIQEAHEKDEFTYLERVKKTHLSQLQAINWLQENNILNYEFIHEHKEREKNDNK